LIVICNESIGRTNQVTVSGREALLLFVNWTHQLKCSNNPYRNPPDPTTKTSNEKKPLPPDSPHPKSGVTIYSQLHPQTKTIPNPMENTKTKNLTQISEHKRTRLPDTLFPQNKNSPNDTTRFTTRLNKQSPNHRKSFALLKLRTHLRTHSAVHGQTFSSYIMMEHVKLFSSSGYRSSRR
jgi:hypothetical protein